MALNRPQGNSILKRSSLVIGGSGDSESQLTLSGTNNEQAQDFTTSPLAIIALFVLTSDQMDRSQIY